MFPAKRVFAVFLALLVSLLHHVFARAEVTVETVMLPMRDGVQLATDIYRDNTNNNGPVVLMRTPYNKNGGKVAAERFAAAGLGEAGSKGRFEIGGRLEGGEFVAQG